MVIITDEATHTEIANVIRNLDRPKPQVLIKVLFLEVTHRKDLDVGVEGSYTYTHEGINSGTLGTAMGLAEITGGGFWTGAPFKVNQWYGYVTTLSHNGTKDSPYFGKDCLNNTWKFRWSSMGMRQAGGGSGQFEPVDAQGRVVKSQPIRVTPGRALQLPVAGARPEAAPVRPR